VLHYTEHPPALLLGWDRLGAGPSGLSADVDHIGAFGYHLLRVGYGVILGEIEPPVREGIGGGIQYAHDVGPIA